MPIESVKPVVGDGETARLVVKPANHHFIIYACSLVFSPISTSCHLPLASPRDQKREDERRVTTDE